MRDPEHRYLFLMNLFEKLSFTFMKEDKGKVVGVQYPREMLLQMYKDLRSLEV